VEQQISGDTHNGNVVLAQNDYNELGELMLKKLHSAGETSFVQDIDYRYDVRGWLNNINNLSDASRRKLYAEQLNYFGNGNIQNMSWKNTLLDAQNAPTQTNTQKYDFTYDGLNRITAAAYSELNASNATVNTDNFSTSYGYDANGNMATLSRQGNKVLSGVTPVYGTIDNLTYLYAYGSNRLLLVNDAIASGTVAHDLEFKSGGGTYLYDGNGNATLMPQKSVTVAYNYLNLPSSVTVGSQGTISYLYDASGNKLKKTVGTVNSYYQGSVLKLNGTDIVMTGEGRAVKNGTWSYEYDLKDHLGNTRVSFSADNASALPLQYKDYYPFGLEMARWYTTVGAPTKYLYNGKELQDECGLGWYDYGARFYDPTIGRWNTMDPLAEISRRWSPYNYCVNNPMRFIDPDGMLIDDYFNKQGQYLGSDNAKTDNVKIIDSKDWDSNKQVSENGSETIDHETGKALSTDFSKASMTKQATLDVYDHYNPTDLKLAAAEKEDGSGGMKFSAESKNGVVEQEIKVKIEGNKDTKIADHANEIVNVFVHEKNHYDESKSAGLNAYQRTPSSIREQRAISTQINHSTFNSTRTSYQNAVRIYGIQNGMLFPLSPRPAIVTP